MKIKVCGLRDPKNMLDVVEAGAHRLGFIFYPSSPRYIGAEPIIPEINQVKKVAVFVNEEPEVVLRVVNDYHFDLVQLHGEESPDYCRQLAMKGIRLIKAFNVGEAFDFGINRYYADSCSEFLFDAKGIFRGGNGKRFDWNLLKRYEGIIPFVLSGGIGPEHAEAIRSIASTDKRLSGIDINSRFEIDPGMKNAESVRDFINELSLKSIVL